MPTVNGVQIIAPYLDIVYKYLKLKSIPLKILVEYLSLEERGRSLHFTHVEDQKNLTSIIEDVFTHLPEAITEGWEVNSHNITISRDTLIITVLLRRQITT